MAALGCSGFLAAVFTRRAAAGWMALFGRATEVVCGLTHHADARGIAGFDRGAFEKPGSELITARFSKFSLY